MKIHLFAALMIGLLSAVPGQAQEISVGGRVVGPDAAPLGGQDVVLHRVDETGGTTIAEALTGPDGRFLLTALPGTDTSAVYFVAARYEGELYIGPPFKPGVSDATDQQIQVGVPGMSASDMLANPREGAAALPATGRPATSRNWLLLFVPLAGVAAVAVFMLIPRSSIPERRALLIRVAELDERAAAAADADRERLLAERANILGRLRTG